MEITEHLPAIGSGQFISYVHGFCLTYENVLISTPEFSHASDSLPHPTGESEPMSV